MEEGEEGEAFSRATSSSSIETALRVGRLARPARRADLLVRRLVGWLVGQLVS